MDVANLHLQPAEVHLLLRCRAPAGSGGSLWPGPKAAWPSTFMASKGLGAAWSWHRLWFNGLPASVEAALQKQSELTN